VPATKLWTL